MNRIENKFRKLKAVRRKAFIPSVTAGDPDITTSLEVVVMLAKNGADIIELGVPFSDPMADGPTIQASSQRALENGVTLRDILQMVRKLRIDTDVPIVLFSYLNPLYRYGFDKLATEAAEAGIDGILVTDVVDEEAAEISDCLRTTNIDLISLIAPTTTDERLEKIAARSNGFLYAVSRTGVTGAQKETGAAAETLVRRTRGFTKLPIAVGFGISQPEHVKAVWQEADGAVVGSAVVRVIEENAGFSDVADRVARFTLWLRGEPA